MKKLFLMLSIFVIIPQLTFASNVEGLKAAIDEYNYSLAVDWDQKDKVFVKEQEDILLQRLSVLAQNGLNRDDLLKAFPGVDSIKMEQELAQINFSSLEEVRYYISARQKSYAKGASWSGDVVSTGVAVLIGIALVTLFITAQVKREKIRSDCLETYKGPDPGAACAVAAGPMQLAPWNVK